jgi:hypothetical protein
MSELCAMPQRPSFLFQVLEVLLAVQQRLFKYLPKSFFFLCFLLLSSSSSSLELDGVFSESEMMPLDL